MSGCDFETAVLLLDEKYQIMFANKACRELYPEIETGMSCLSFLEQEDVLRCCGCFAGEEDTGVTIHHAGQNRLLKCSFEHASFPGCENGWCITLSPASEQSAELKAVINPASLIRSNRLNLENSITWNLALDNMPNGYHRCAADKGWEFLFISNRFCEIVGYTEEEITLIFKKQLFKMIHPEDLRMVEDFTRRISSDKNTYGETVYRLRNKTRENGYIWVLVSSKLVSTADEMFFQSAVTDITDYIEEQEQIKEDLLHSRMKINQYKKALVSGGDTIYEVNASRDILEHATFFDNGIEIPSESIDVTFPCSYSDLVKRMAENVPQRQKEYCARINSSAYFLEKFQKGVLKWQVEYEAYTVQHTRCYIRKQYTLTEDSATGEIHALVVAQDITDKTREKRMQESELRRALAEAKKADQAKSRFLFNMSHDIRTPMNAIIGFNGIAQKHCNDPDRVLDALKKSEIAGEHLLKLIDEVLEMARIENGKIRIQYQCTYLPDYLDELEEMFRSSMEEKNIEFIVEEQYNEEYIYMDATRVMQILTNLLGNAMKFTPPGGKIIFRSREIKNCGDGFVEREIHVIDNGIGMSREFQKKLFDAFERENTSTNSGVEGTGLGLSIAKTLSNLLGGSLTCDSEQGKGTCFTFRYRAKIAPRPESPDVSPKSIGSPPTALQGKRLLVAEDNALNLEIAAAILQDSGFEVDTAENGAEAVRKTEAENPGYYDLILMDIQMPVMDGYTAAREIRKLPDAKRAGIPIVAMTANAFEDDRKKAIAAGMNGYLSKPIRVKELIETLTRILEKKTVS